MRGAPMGEVNRFGFAVVARTARRSGERLGGHPQRMFLCRFQRFKVACKTADPARFRVQEEVACSQR